jgi:hypothetical protein
MKNILLILLLILAFAGCKDDDQPVVDSETKVEYDEWRKLPDSILNVGTIGIMALERRGGVVHINTEKRYYSLDTSLNALESRSMTTSGSWYQLWAPRFGKDYAVHRGDGTMIRVSDNSQPTNFDVSLTTNQLSKDELLYINISDITDDQKFSSISLLKTGDSSYYLLQDWEVDHSPGSQSKIELQEVNSIKIDTTLAHVWSSGDIKVYRFENRVIVNIGVNVWVYEGGRLLTKYRSDFENLIIKDGVIYGGGDNAGPRPEPEGLHKNGLMKSVDGGLTWEFTSLDSRRRRLNFKIIGGHIFVFGQGGFGIMYEDFSDGWQADTDGLFDMPRNLEKVGKYAMVGTDQGIYYKSWESFLNK